MKMIKQFTIYKKGTTDRPVDIVSLEGAPFDKAKKIAFYKWLGYTVTINFDIAPYG